MHRTRNKLLSLALSLVMLLSLLPAMSLTASAAEVADIEVIYDANKAPVNPLYKHYEWDDKFGYHNQADAFSVSGEGYRLANIVGGYYAMLLAREKSSTGNYQSVTGGRFSIGAKISNIDDTQYSYAINVEVSLSAGSTLADISHRVVRLLG